MHQHHLPDAPCTEHTKHTHIHTHTHFLGSSECYLGNTFYRFFWQNWVWDRSRRRLSMMFGSHCDPNLWSAPEQSNHWAQSAVTHTHTHTHTKRTNFESSALMSPPDSSFISSVVLLLNPVCASVSLLCQSWVSHANISLVRLRWQTKGTGCFFFPQNLKCVYLNA